MRDKPIAKIAKANDIDAFYTDWDDMIVYQDGEELSFKDIDWFNDWKYEKTTGLSWAEAMAKKGQTFSRTFNYSVVSEVDTDHGSTMWQDVG